METTLDIAAELAAMAKMPPRELREKYRELFGDGPRCGSPQWLFRRCAWRLQALAEGDLSDRARRRARELARDVDLRVLPPRGMTFTPRTDLPRVTRPAKAHVRRRRDARLPMPGTHLRRKYKGHVYQVEVLDQGFLYDGVVYRSLSAIAYAISGSHWNGYLFFGIADPRKEPE
jgi:hypothetical protein